MGGAFLPRVAAVIGKRFTSAKLSFLILGSVLVLTAGCETFYGHQAVPPPTDDLSSLARQARGTDPRLEPFSFSNKARAIEADLGAAVPKTPPQ